MRRSSYGTLRRNSALSGSLSSVASSLTSSDGDFIARFSLDEVEQHDDPCSCWIVIIDFVFDVTKFIESHPGGIEVITAHYVAFFDRI